MRTIKFALPALVFIFAIAAAFTTQASKSVIEAVPNHFESLTECPSCQIPNAPGNIYGTHYGCETVKVSNVRCTCVFQGILKDATVIGTGGTSCAPLWRYQIIP
jgi:hypothetical protein